MSILNKIIDELPFSEGELKELIITAQHRYKVYKIPKRKLGLYRTIAQPSPEVKLLQTWLIQNVLNRLPVHKSAMAYREGVSTFHHAEIHSGSKFLLKMDFENFFTSISYESIFNFLTNVHGFSLQEARIICLIACWRDKRDFSLCLSMGAPSSPAISNFMMYEFDKSVVKLCRSLKVKYSRYADDLAFSTNSKNVLEIVQKKIPEILSNIDYPKLVLNLEKTVSTSKAHKRTLVGLVLTPDGKVSIGRDKKRNIRSRLYRYCNDELSSEDISSLRGELAYIWSVEKSFIFSLILKFGVEAFNKLELPFGRYFRS